MTKYIFYTSGGFRTPNLHFRNCIHSYIHTYYLMLLEWELMRLGVDEVIKFENKRQAQIIRINTSNKPTNLPSFCIANLLELFHFQEINSRKQIHTELGSDKSLFINNTREKVTHFKLLFSTAKQEAEIKQHIQKNI